MTRFLPRASDTSLVKPINSIANIQNRIILNLHGNKSCRGTSRDTTTILLGGQLIRRAGTPQAAEAPMIRKSEIFGVPALRLGTGSGAASML
jgi:hypothetical protein